MIGGVAYVDAAAAILVNPEKAVMNASHMGTLYFEKVDRCRGDAFDLRRSPTSPVQETPPS